MTELEAHALFERVRVAASELWRLVEELHDREAWRAAGYATFAECLRAEFGFGKSRGYQLLAHARFVRQVEQSTAVDLSVLPERLTRSLMEWRDEFESRLRSLPAVRGESEADRIRRLAEDLRDDVEWAARWAEVMNEHADWRRWPVEHQDTGRVLVTAFAFAVARWELDLPSGRWTPRDVVRCRGWWRARPDAEVIELVDACDVQWVTG